MIIQNLLNLKKGELISLYDNVPFIFECMFSWQTTCLVARKSVAKNTKPESHQTAKIFLSSSWCALKVGKCCKWATTLFHNHQQSSLPLLALFLGLWYFFKLQVLKKLCGGLGARLFPSKIQRQLGWVQISCPQIDKFCTDTGMDNTNLATSCQPREILKTTNSEWKSLCSSFMFLLAQFFVTMCW